MDREKHVDESWKELASEEKDKLAETVTQPPTEDPEGGSCSCGHGHDHDHDHDHEVEVNFLNYITSLGFQAMIFMGEIPNPMTNEVEQNMTQAKFLIDTLAMLKEKTAGNLDDQEKDLLENSVYELQLRYVQHVQQDAAGSGDKVS